MRSEQFSPTKLVDLEAGVISREIFVNRDIYEEEQERIFTRAWLFVGHESLVPNPGDFFTSSMGEEYRTKENDLTGIRSQIREIREQLRHERNLVQGSYTETPNPEVARLQGQIDTLDLQRINLLQYHKETEPEVRNVDAQIARVRAALRKRKRKASHRDPQSPGRIWIGAPARVEAVQ